MVQLLHLVMRAGAPAIIVSVCETILGGIRSRLIVVAFSKCGPRSIFKFPRRTINQKFLHRSRSVTASRVKLPFFYLRLVKVYLCQFDIQYL